MKADSLQRLPNLHTIIKEEEKSISEATENKIVPSIVVESQLKNKIPKKKDYSNPKSKPLRVKKVKGSSFKKIRKSIQKIPNSRAMKKGSKL